MRNHPNQPLTVFVAVVVVVAAVVVVEVGLE